LLRITSGQPVIRPEDQPSITSRNLSDPQTTKNKAKTPALYKIVTILGIIISRQLAYGRNAAGPIMRESYIQIRNSGSLVGCFNIDYSSIAESVWCRAVAGATSISFSEPRSFDAVGHRRTTEFETRTG
jgi:hypothetical protein